MGDVQRVESVLEDLKALAPAGFAIALHVQFTTPKYLFQTYPKDWMEEYTRKGLVMHDPTVRWGLENEGEIIWSDLADLDAAGVLTLASEYGLSHGITIARVIDASKSIASFSREDRAFNADETTDILEKFETLHRESAGGAEAADFDGALKRLSVALTHG